MSNKKIKVYDVIEGDSGVLYLTDQFGEKDIFQPDYDLDKARKMLYEFYHLDTNKKKLVKDSFLIDGRNWFPNSVSQLYWQFFVPVVKFKVLLDKYIDGEISFSKITSVSDKASRFKILILIISGNKEKKKYSVAKNLYNKIINLRNLLIVRKKGDVMIYKYLVDDFRLKDLVEDLSKDLSILTISWVSKKNFLKYIFNRDVFFYTYPATLYEDNISIVNNPSIYFNLALRFAQSTITSQIISKKNIQKTFKKLDYKLFLGLDDANVVYPLIYAANDIGLRTVGIQHGAYSRRHEAYFMNFVDKYDWFDNVIVWGKYWQDIILNNSKLFPKDFHLIGSKKLPFDLVENKTKNNKTILIPYEFLSDTILYSNSSAPFSVNNISGEITWSPKMIGNFVASLTIQEYRNGMLIGVMNRDMQFVVVSDTSNFTPQISNMQTLPTNNLGYPYIKIAPGQNFQVHLLASDADISDVVSMSTFGESFGLTTAPSSFSYISTGNGNEIEGTFSWTPDVSQVRVNPYLVVFRTSDNFFYYDETVQFEVTYNTTAFEDFNELKTNNIYPNPASTNFTLQLSLTKKKVVEVSIYNTLGIKVSSEKLNLSAGNHMLVKNFDLKNGQYFVNITDDNGLTIVTRKLLVVK